MRDYMACARVVIVFAHGADFVPSLSSQFRRLDGRYLPFVVCELVRVKISGHLRSLIRYNVSRWLMRA